MLSIMLSMVLAHPVLAPVHKEQTVYQIQAVVYQGNPDAQRAKEELNIISSPKLVTRNGQMAQVQVGQVVPVVTDIQVQNGRVPKDAIISKAMVAEHVGITMSMTATEQTDGTIFLSAYVQAKELIKATDGTESVLERAMKVRRLNKLGEKITVPLYNPNDYIERIKVQGSDEIQTRKKPYTGKETWVELVVTEHKP